MKTISLLLFGLASTFAVVAAILALLAVLFKELSCKRIKAPSRDLKTIPALTFKKTI